MNRAFSARGIDVARKFLGRCPQASLNVAPLALNTYPAKSHRSLFSTAARRYSILMGWSLPILRIAGIPIANSHYVFAPDRWLAFGYYAEGGSSVALARVLFILLLFVCVVLHEFGHAIAAKSFGINTPDITLLPIGGVARLERMPEEPGQELIIAAAGPAVNVVIALCLLLVVGSRAFDPAILQATISLTANLLGHQRWAGSLQSVAGVSNGRWPDFAGVAGDAMSYARATQAAATVGQAFAFIFGFLGLFSNPMLIFIALFVLHRRDPGRGGGTNARCLARFACLQRHGARIPNASGKRHFAGSGGRAARDIAA